MDRSHSGKQILITGGVGFIGSQLARRLVQQGAVVTLLDSLVPEYGGNLRNIVDIEGQVRVNISDVRDPYSLRTLLRGKDYLFNLAGQTSHIDSMQDPITDLRINVESQLAILEACRVVCPDIRVVFASTRQIYGRPQSLPVDERHPIVPVDVNGIHKLAAEHYHRLYNEVYALRTTCLRLTNTIGPGMRIKDARQTFVGIWIRQVLEGIPLRVFGNGDQLRDFNAVHDVVDAMLLVAEREQAVGKVYNLGGGIPISLSNLAARLCALNGNGSFELVPFPANLKKIDIGDYYGAYDLIQKDLGWAPKVDLDSILAETLEYYRKNIAWYV